MKLFVRLLTFLLILGAAESNFAQSHLISATEVDERAAAFMAQNRLERIQFSQRNAHLFENKRSAGISLRSSNLSTLWIPVQIHVAANGPYYQAIDFLALSTLLSEVNAGLQAANIQLYSCGSANVIDDSNVYSLFTSNESILDNHDVAGKLNIYFVDDLKLGINGPYYCGSSSYPGQGERIIYSTGCFGYSSSSVMLHLLGQYFSLYPTHGPNGATPEYVDGSNCTTAGDEICDTPADPRLNQAGYMSGCTYAAPITVVDPQGDNYQPNTTNFMSYASGSCRDHFSPQQMARMYYSAQNDRSFVACSGAPGCSQPVDQFPYSIGFENGMEDWNNSPFYAYVIGGDFQIHSGATPTSGTGPAAAIEGNQYVYADADMVPSPTAFYPVAILESPCFDFRGLNAPEMTFKYHMSGTGCGSLFLQVSTDGGYNWVTQSVNLFNISGDQGNAWNTQTVDLSSLTSEATAILRFGVQFTTSNLGDIAIDDIVIAESASCATALDAIVALTDESCYGLADGTATLSFNQMGTLPYTITWSTGDLNVGQITGLLPGTYSVTVEDANSCTDVETFTIAGPATPVSIALTATPQSGNTAAAGDLQVVATGGIPPYAYTWSNGNTTANVTGVASGNYSVTVVDATGCSASSNIFLSTTYPCNGTKSNWPYFLGLEGGVGLFRQNSDDDLNWKKRAGTTPTNGTGPTVAAEGNYYRFVESSGWRNPSKTAVLTTKKCLNLSNVVNPVFEFQYHMFGGADMGSLEVQISTDGGTTWLPSIWRQDGDQGNTWHQASIELSAYASQSIRLRIVGTTGNGNKSDMAIDDLYIGTGSGSNLRAVPDYGTEEVIVSSNPFKIMQSVFPNPAIDRINLKLDLPDNEQFELRLVNLTGNTLRSVQLSTPGKQDLEMQVADLPNGMYYLLVKGNKGRLETLPVAIAR